MIIMNERSSSFQILTVISCLLGRRWVQQHSVRLQVALHKPSQLTCRPNCKSLSKPEDIWVCLQSFPLKTGNKILLSPRVLCHIRNCVASRKKNNFQLVSNFHPGKKFRLDVFLKILPLCRSKSLHWSWQESEGHKYLKHKWNEGGAPHLPPLHHLLTVNVAGGSVNQISQGYSRISSPGWSCSFHSRCLQQRAILWAEPSLLLGHILHSPWDTAKHSMVYMLCVCVDGSQPCWEDFHWIQPLMTEFWAKRWL